MQLSDVGLRKICVKFGIPLPLRGHWARLQVGKQDPRPELPFENNNPQIRLPDEETAATREQLSLIRKLAKQAEQAIEPVLREPVAAGANMPRFSRFGNTDGF